MRQRIFELNKPKHYYIGIPKSQYGRPGSVAVGPEVGAVAVIGSTRAAAPAPAPARA